MVLKLTMRVLGMDLAANAGSFFDLVTEINGRLPYLVDELMGNPDADFAFLMSGLKSDKESIMLACARAMTKFRDLDEEKERSALLIAKERPPDIQYPLIIMLANAGFNSIDFKEYLFDKISNHAVFDISVEAALEALSKLFPYGHGTQELLAGRLLAREERMDAWEYSKTLEAMGKIGEPIPNLMEMLLSRYAREDMDDEKRLSIVKVFSGMSDLPVLVLETLLDRFRTRSNSEKKAIIDCIEKNLHKIDSHEIVRELLKASDEELKYYIAWKLIH
jgi:hypothetical protein